MINILYSCLIKRGLSIGTFKRNEGFTIVELIVVLGILSILALIFFPKINASEKKLMLNGRMLWDDIRYIRYIRMTKGTPMKISFPRETNDSYIVLDGNNKIKTVHMDENIEIFHNFNDNTIFFSLNGVPSNSSAGTIKIYNTKIKKYVEITIVPCTGRILLKDEIIEGFIKD